MAINTMLLIAAIAYVESGDCDIAVGSRKEISRYQILPATWDQYDELKKTRYQNPAISKHVALQHLEFVRARLKAAGKNPDNVVNIAVCWNYGTKRINTDYSRLPQKTRKYAFDVNAKYMEYVSADTRYKMAKQSHEAIKSVAKMVKIAGVGVRTHSGVYSASRPVIQIGISFSEQFGQIGNIPIRRPGPMARVIPPQITHLAAAGI